MSNVKNSPKFMTWVPSSRRQPKSPKGPKGPIECNAFLPFALVLLIHSKEPKSKKN